MKVTLLGTSAGEMYPGFWCECPNCAAARRLGGRNVRGNCCAMVDSDVLIDMNEYFFHMALRLNIRPTQIRTLLVTHPHRDHFAPMLLTQRSMKPSLQTLTDEQRQRAISPCFTSLPLLEIYGNAHVEAAIRAVPGLMEAQEDCRFRFHRIEDGREERLGHMSFIPVRSRHGSEAGFAHNYIISRGGKTLLYATDTGGYDPDMLDIVLAHRYDGVVLEGTFGLGAECDTHMNLDKDKAFVRLLREHGCLADGARVHLTHICPHWAPPHDEYAAIVAKEGMELGYDGESFQV